MQFRNCGAKLHKISDICKKMKTFFIFYGQFLSSSIARHSKLIVIFLLAAFSSYVVHCPACHAAYIKICTEKSEISQNSHFSYVIFCCTLFPFTSPCSLSPNPLSWLVPFYLYFHTKGNNPTWIKKKKHTAK